MGEGGGRKEGRKSLPFPQTSGWWDVTLESQTSRRRQAGGLGSGGNAELLFTQRPQSMAFCEVLSEPPFPASSVLHCPLCLVPGQRGVGWGSL